MHDGTTDTMRVVFPADEQFSRIGRVAVAGLALRLEIDVQQVEQLRLAVDEAIGSLTGSGSIVVEADWRPGHLRIEVTNPDAAIDLDRRLALEGTLGGLVDRASVDASGVALVLGDLL